MPLDLSGLPEPLQQRTHRMFLVGKNYRAHVEFMGDPVPLGDPLVFTKPSTSLSFPGQGLWYPPSCQELHPEAELVAIVGKTGRDLSPDSASEVLMGLGSGLDMTDRGNQKIAKEKGWPWDRAKGFDGSAALGDWIPYDGKSPLPGVRLFSGEETLQEVDPRGMTHDLGAILASLSRCFTLRPGDLIFTGAPAGTSPVQPGDRLELQLGNRERVPFEVTRERP